MINNTVSLAISLKRLWQAGFIVFKAIPPAATPTHCHPLALEASVTASVYDSLSLPQSAAATQIAPINTPAFSVSLHFRLI